MILRIRWVNRNQWVNWMNQRLSSSKMQLLEEAVGRAAIRTQQEMRNHLERLVYAQPSSASGYVRTYTLMRSTHAASPEDDHSADESRSANGSDLRASSASDVVNRRGDTIMSEVGSWISYAWYVHEGASGHGPRPFVTMARPEAERALQQEVEQAVVRMMAA